MTANQIAMLIYAVFLIFILIVNFLYFFQVFKYRLSGDISLTILSLHLLTIVTILVVSGVLLSV